MPEGTRQGKHQAEEQQNTDPCDRACLDHEFPLLGTARVLYTEIGSDYPPCNTADSAYDRPYYPRMHDISPFFTIYADRQGALKRTIETDLPRPA